MIGLLLALASFTTCAVGGLWAIGALGAGQRASEVDAPAPRGEPDDPWIARDGASTTGRHVWAGQTATGALRTPPDCAAIVVGPPKSGKTRKVIAPTLACWAGPALVTSTKGDILKTAAHRARLGSVAVYDPTGSLGCPEVSVGLTPLSRCGTWDGAVEVAAALLSPASADENVRHGEHFAIAARARLVPMERSADLKHVVEAFATALAKAVPNLSHEERAETTRHFGDSLAVIAEHTPGEAIPTVRRIVEATERELGSDSST